MARKLALTSESSLSPPPHDLQDMAPEQATPKVKGEGRKRKAAVKDELEASDGEPTPKPKKRTVKKVKAEIEVEEKANGEAKTTMKKAITKRQVKNKEADTPLAERTVGSKLRVGAHVSTAGGVQNSVANILYIGGNAAALFLKNQRRWDNAPLSPEAATLFIEGCKAHSIDVASCCLPHGSYLVNLAHPDADRKKQSYECFVDDLKRCNTLGIKLYNFHPGNANACTREKGIETIAENINQALKDPDTGEVIAVLETMASLGNTIGGTFKDIADIIALVENKDRIGVCIDTCHIFAAGYDLRTPQAYAATMEEFDRVIGLRYLKALHMNDSKAPFDSHRDLHAQIGTGHLGLRSFHNVANDERLHGLPMVLETPTDIEVDGKKVEDKGVWAREIKLLERLVGMDIESEEFKTLEKDLHADAEGTKERARIQGQVDRKKAKDAGEKVPRKKKDAGEKASKKNPTKAPKEASKKKSSLKVPGDDDGDDDEE